MRCGRRAYSPLSDRRDSDKLEREVDQTDVQVATGRLFIKPSLLILEIRHLWQVRPRDLDIVSLYAERTGQNALIREKQV